MESKVCSKCKELLSIDIFSTYKTKKNIKHNKTCKKCKSIDSTIWRLKNKEKRKQNDKKYYEKNREKFLLYQKKNKEKINIYLKQWRIENRDKIKLSIKNWHNNNKNKSCNILDNNYILRLLCDNNNLSRDNIKQYPELIEAKRLQILTKRLCRTSQN